MPTCWPTAGRACLRVSVVNHSFAGAAPAFAAGEGVQGGGIAFPDLALTTSQDDWIIVEPGRGAGKVTLTGIQRGKVTAGRSESEFASALPGMRGVRGIRPAEIFAGLSHGNSQQAGFIAGPA